MVELIVSSQAIDQQPTELIAVFFFEDERPLRSEAKLIDWLMGGMISSRLNQGLMTGRLLETTLIPATEKVKAEKILLIGLGETAAFDYGRMRKLAEKVVTTCLGLQIHDLVLTLPSPQQFGLEWTKLLAAMMEGIGSGLQRRSQRRHLRVRFSGGSAYCDQIVRGVNTAKGSLKNSFPFRVHREQSS
jgi:hypothetical protein